MQTSRMLYPEDKKNNATKIVFNKSRVLTTPNPAQFKGIKNQFRFLSSQGNNQHILKTANSAWQRAERAENIR